MRILLFGTVCTCYLNLSNSVLSILRRFFRPLESILSTSGVGFFDPDELLHIDAVGASHALMGAVDEVGLLQLAEQLHGFIPLAAEGIADFPHGVDDEHAALAINPVVFLGQSHTGEQVAVKQLGGRVNAGVLLVMDNDIGNADKGKCVGFVGIKIVIGSQKSPSFFAGQIFEQGHVAFAGRQDSAAFVLHVA